MNKFFLFSSRENEKGLEKFDMAYRNLLSSGFFDKVTDEEEKNIVLFFFDFFIKRGL